MLIIPTTFWLNYHVAESFNLKGFKWGYTWMAIKFHDCLRQNVKRVVKQQVYQFMFMPQYIYTRRKYLRIRIQTKYVRPFFATVANKLNCFFMKLISKWIKEKREKNGSLCFGMHIKHLWSAVYSNHSVLETLIRQYLQCII